MAKEKEPAPTPCKCRRLDGSTSSSPFPAVPISLAKDLNENVDNLNKTLQNLSAKNLEEIYINIIKSIETMKNETDKIGWRFHKELDEYDSKFSGKLQNSLESIDEQTVKIIEDLQEFKELSK